MRHLSLVVAQLAVLVEKLVAADHHRIVGTFEERMRVEVTTRCGSEYYFATVFQVGTRSLNNIECGFIYDFTFKVGVGVLGRSITRRHGSVGI